MRNRPEIDGLRAIAVLAVLFFHANAGVSGGYVGVDVFFVISGYLITRLILEDIDAGRFQIQKFWERRVRRILPALAVVTFSTLVAGWFLLLPEGFQELGESAAAQAMLGSNLYFWVQSWINSGYFAPASEMKPLLHTWSLAVEEQFYLLFPFLVIALRRCSRKTIAPAFLLLGGLSFGLSVYCSYQFPSANFYFLPTRAWELLVGALLAASSERQSSAGWLREVLSWGGLILILCSMFGYDRDTRFPGLAALPPCLGAALIIWANNTRPTLSGKFLAARPLVFIGLISYSLYLWHWPMLVFTKYWPMGAFAVWRRMAVLLASVMLAALSWKFVETPFRKRIIFKTRRQIFAFAGTMTALLFVAGTSVYVMQGVPSRLSLEVRRYAEGQKDKRYRLNTVLRDAINGSFGELGAGDKHQPVKLLVWGDSHAMAVAPVLDALCKQHSVRGVQATHTITAPLVDFPGQYQYSLKQDAVPFNDAIIKFIQTKHVSDVLLAARWDYYMQHYADAESGSNAVCRCLLATIKELKDAGARVWIMKDVPRQPWNDPASVLAQAALFGGNPGEMGLPVTEYRKQSQVEDAIFEAVAAPGVVVLDPTPCLVNRENVCRVAEGGYSLYADKDHLTTHGAMLLRPLFEPIFDR